MFNKKNAKFFLLLFLINLIFLPKAYAYLDPGNGSMILQMILAGIFGFVCTFKIWINKFLTFFKKKDRNDK